MKKLFIVRHGETDNNKDHIIQGRSLDASLNEMGRLQAEAIAEELQQENIERIICSGLVRTYETARPLATRLGMEIETYPELDEINFGVLEGKNFHEIQDQVMDVHRQWKSGNTTYAPDKGESPEVAFQRANTKVCDLLESAQEQNLLFMVHGRLIRILLSVWLGHGLHNMHKIEHRNGAINILTWKSGRFTAQSLNAGSHLHELA